MDNGGHNTAAPAVMGRIGYATLAAAKSTWLHYIHYGTVNDKTVFVAEFSFILWSLGLSKKL